MPTYESDDLTIGIPVSCFSQARLNPSAVGLMAWILALDEEDLQFTPGRLVNKGYYHEKLQAQEDLSQLEEQGYLQVQQITVYVPTPKLVEMEGGLGDDTLEAFVSAAMEPEEAISDARPTEEEYLSQGPPLREGWELGLQEEEVIDLEDDD